MPDETVSILTHLTALIDALALSVRDRFEERDTRYQQRFDAQTKAIADALQAAKEAVIKAEVAADKRFEAVNEFRSTLSDQATTFISRAEFTAVREAAEERIALLTARLDKSEGRTQGGANLWAIIIGVVVVLVMAIGIYVNARG